jgi:hypothetical protein
VPITMAVRPKNKTKGLMDLPGFKILWKFFIRDGEFASWMNQVAGFEIIWTVRPVFLYVNRLTELGEDQSFVLLLLKVKPLVYFYRMQKPPETVFQAAFAISEDKFIPPPF